jgi:hypothetical protein
MDQTAGAGAGDTSRRLDEQMAKTQERNDGDAG